MLYRITGGRWLDPRRVDVAPVRRAEYAVVDQFGVAVISAGVLVLAALYGGVAALRLLTAHRETRPPRLSIGWRRLVKVVGLGAVLPVALYLAYARLTPLGGRATGLNVTLIRVSIEYGVLAFLVLVLVSVLTRRAIVARAAELRLTQSPSFMRELAHPWVVTVVVAILAAAFCLTIALVTAAGIDHAIVQSMPKRIAQQASTPAILAAWMFLAYAAVRLAYPGLRRCAQARGIKLPRAHRTKALRVAGWRGRRSRRSSRRPWCWD